jgi:hypothetical protein
MNASYPKTASFPFVILLFPHKNLRYPLIDAERFNPVCHNTIMEVIDRVISDSHYTMTDRKIIMAIAQTEIRIDKPDLLYICKIYLTRCKHFGTLCIAHNTWCKKGVSKMSYQEKRTITGIFSAILILVAYILFILTKFHTGTIHNQDVRFWAGSILIFIGIGIVSAIVIQIVFHILLSISIAVKETDYGRNKSKDINKAVMNSMVDDEMHRMIELKSSKSGFYFTGIGFIASLISLVLGFPIAVMLNILFVSWILGWIFEGFMRLNYYRKGLGNA